MIKSITNVLIIFFIFQQLKSQISQMTKMELTRFAMKLFIIYRLCTFCINAEAVIWIRTYNDEDAFFL